MKNQVWRCLNTQENSNKLYTWYRTIDEDRNQHKKYKFTQLIWIVAEIPVVTKNVVIEILYNFNTQSSVYQSTSLVNFKKIKYLV